MKSAQVRNTLWPNLTFQRPRSQIRPTSLKSLRNRESSTLSIKKCTKHTFQAVQAVQAVLFRRGYPASVIQAAHHRAQQIDRQSTLQTSQREKNDRIPFTLTFHPRNNPVKAIILNNFKILQNDPETGAIFSQPPLISFKRDKNVGNFLVRSAFKTIEKPGTFKCARSRCKTCPFVQNADKIWGPKRSVKITDRFTCTSANVIYCITCTLCKKLYIGETGRRLGDRFREHLRDVEKDDKDASKPVARHFNLPNHSKEHMSICGLSLHQGTTDSRKNLEQRFIFQIGTVNPHGINERFSFN